MANAAALRHAFDFADAPDASPGALDFYRQHLAAEGPTLVAMCGIGRLLVPLAGGGASLHGVDGSAAALAVCASRLAAAKLDALLVRQAPDELNLAFRYRTAFIADGALQWLVDPTRALAALARLAAHLVAPAQLIVEFVVPAEARHAPGAPIVEVRSASADDGARIVWRSETRVDVDARRVDRINRFEMRRGREIVAREDERSALTWYAEDEIAPMLQGAGFGAVALTPVSWDGAHGEQRVMAVAHLD